MCSSSGISPLPSFNSLISVIADAHFLLACVVLPVCPWRRGPFERGPSQGILSRAIQEKDNTEAAAANQALGHILKFSCVNAA